MLSCVRNKDFKFCDDNVLMIDPVQSFWYKVYDELKLALLIEI